MSNEQQAIELTEHAVELVESTLFVLYRRHPEMQARYGTAGRQRCREDVAFHFQVLTEALLAEDANIFLKYVGWGKSVLASRGVRTDDLLDCLLIMQDAITESLRKAAAAKAKDCIQLAVDTFDAFTDSPPSCIDPGASLSNIANSYLEALLSSDRSQARKVIESAALSGIGLTEIYQHVFQPVQREVGRLWQVNQITVAQEHYCTAMTDAMISELQARAKPEAVEGPLFVGACVPGEQHSIGLRMVCDEMEAHGWRVYFTGANTPTTSVVDLIKRLNVAALGLSCATPMQLPNVRLAIASVRASRRDTKIMVGGRVFNDFPGLWKKVGADAYAEDAVSAVRVAAKLTGVKTAVSNRA